MQTLYFHDAWEKTISTADRNKITNHFHEHQPKEAVVLSFLWQAVNYKNEKLITVLIHNKRKTSLSFDQTPIAYSAGEERHLTNLFDLPLPVPPETSMPWTFIFSENKNTNQRPLYTIMTQVE